MNELQHQLKELAEQNAEMKVQVVTWHRMFSGQVRLREAMKRIMADIWQHNPLPALGLDVSQVICGLEDGSLDSNQLHRLIIQANGAPPLAGTGSGSGGAPCLPAADGAGGSGSGSLGMAAPGVLPSSPSAAAASLSGQQEAQHNMVVHAPLFTSAGGFLSAAPPLTVATTGSGQVYDTMHPGQLAAGAATDAAASSGGLLFAGALLMNDGDAAGAMPPGGATITTGVNLNNAGTTG